MGNSRPIFRHFRLFFTVDNKQMFYMTGFEPRTSGVQIDRSTNWALTTALVQCNFATYIEALSLDVASHVTH